MHFGFKARFQSSFLGKAAGFPCVDENLTKPFVARLIVQDGPLRGQIEVQDLEFQKERDKRGRKDSSRDNNNMWEKLSTQTQRAESMRR